jgi:hypothetical protein
LARVKLVVEEALVDLVSDLDQLLPVGVGQHPADSEVAGVVDGRLGSERAALFEILLDLRGAVVDLDRRFDPAVEDLGVKPAGGPTGHAPAEDHGGLVRPSERELIGERLLEPRAGGGGLVEHAGVGDLKLAERELIAVSAGAILVGERGRERRDPAIEERAHVRGLKALADLGQRCLIGARSEPVVQRRKRDSLPGGLLLGPLVPVQIRPTE